MLNFALAGSVVISLFTWSQEVTRQGNRQPTLPFILITDLAILHIEAVVVMADPVEN